VHPAAALFPLLSVEELKALGKDIIKTGLTSSIMLWRPDPKSPIQLLDGQNRLAALELVTNLPVQVQQNGSFGNEKFLATPCCAQILDGREIDPWAYVRSANILRRQLTSEEKQKALVDLVAAQPEKSDRELAKQAGVSHPSIAKARRTAEATGKALPVAKRVGGDGKARKRPAKKATKAKKAKQPPEQPAPAEPAAASSIGDIGANSAGEIKRLQTRTAKLENQKRQLETKIEGLRNELEEAKSAKTKNKDKRPSRAARWKNAAATAFEALEELLAIQEEEYGPWRDNLPDNLQNSCLSEKLDDVCNVNIEDALKTAEKAKNLDGALLSEKEVRALDLEGAREIAEDAGSLDLPLGFGRD
jgi:hypothetical protein